MLMGPPAMGLMMALCMIFVFCTDAYLYEVLTVLTSVIGEVCFVAVLRVG